VSDVKWHGEEFKKLTKAEIGRRLSRAAIVVERHAKQLVSVSGTGVWAKAGLSRHGKLLQRKKRLRGYLRVKAKSFKAYNRLAKKLGWKTRLKQKQWVTKAGTLSSRRRRKRKK